MKENKYDDPVFFAKYAQMDRSRLGLKGAGEWRTLEPMLPDFAGRDVLDLGCGYGWHCAYAAEHGARSVLGLDLSEKMLAVARRDHVAPVIEYRRMAMEDTDFADGSFDVVLSSLAFHYVADFGALVRNIARWLRPGGDFVFSCEHRYSPPRARRTGTATRMAISCTSRWTTTISRASGRRCSSASG